MSNSINFFAFSKLLMLAMQFTKHGYSIMLF